MGKHKSGKKNDKKTEAPERERKVRFEDEPAQKLDDNAVVAKLHLYVDLESRHVGIKELSSGDVGHTWVALEWNDPKHVPREIPDKHRNHLKQGGKYSDSMGFWPDLEGLHTPDGEGVGYTKNPFKSVQGHMRHPDTAHQGKEKASMTYDLTYKQAKKAIEYADSKVAAQYSVYFFNCTTFAKNVVEKAGQNAPSMQKGPLCLPDAAFNGIQKWANKGKKGAEAKGEDFINQGSLKVKLEQVQLPYRVRYFLGKEFGLKVVAIDPSSNAKDQLKVGDIITHFNGYRSNSEATIRRGCFGKINQDVNARLIDPQTYEEFLKEAGGDKAVIKANKGYDIADYLTQGTTITVSGMASEGKKKGGSRKKGGKKKKAA